MPNPRFDRARSLDELASVVFDVVVIGGGITGAGTALDAASRGLRTALIERDDLASGTSSKSSKLVHGGLRYLQNGEIRLVYEALAERHNLRRNAPHLVGEQPFLIPLLSKDGLVNPKIARALGTAMWGYDLTGGLRSAKRHRRLSAAAALAHCPTLRADRVAGAYLYSDCAADDARLTLTLARTAAEEHDATVATRVEVTGFESTAGRIDTVAARTAEGDHLSIRTRSVINAAGVWADRLAGLDPTAPPLELTPAKGVHVTLPRHLFDLDVALVLPVPKDRRSVFVVPQGNVVYIGTTDTEYDGPLDQPTCTAADIAYVLSAVRAHTTTKVEPTDIVGTWAGLRPLVANADSNRTADLSRRHSVTTSSAGMVTVTGGKLTTYRAMAADAVDALADVVSRDAPVGRCRTRRMALWGAVGHDRVVPDHRGRSVLSDAELAHLAGRYGAEAGALVALVQNDPTLAEPLVAGMSYLRAEAVFAARYEMAMTLDDVLSRRTRARLYARDASDQAAAGVAELVADELGWSSAETTAQTAAYRALLAAERASEQPVGVAS
jgi:glycerol-3-phosphate dehydrogenase